MPSLTPLLVIPIILGLQEPSPPPVGEKRIQRIDLETAMADPASLRAFPPNPRWTHPTDPNPCRTRAQ